MKTPHKAPLSAKLLTALGAVAALLLLFEGYLRVFLTHVDVRDSYATSLPRVQYFAYNDRVGYEPEPFASFTVWDLDRGTLYTERMNSEGFRGPEYAIPKPEGTYRVMVAGDSIAQAYEMTYPDSWEKRLEDLLNRSRVPEKSPKRYEVINAAVMGYVSWQSVVRLHDRGMKYQPDLVLLLVGSNDMAYSTLPFWYAGLDLSQFGIFKKESNPTVRKQVWKFILKYSHIAKHLALRQEALKQRLNRPTEIELALERRHNPKASFNEKGLKQFVHNLELVRKLVKARGGRLCLITWPVVLSPDLFNDQQILRKMHVTYMSFRLSPRQLYSGILSYHNAQREFAARYPDVLLIDAAKRFSAVPKEERLELFMDVGHLSREGNQLLARFILEVLAREGWVGTGR
jgi:lysophospholipase L1-like esterase